MSSGFSIIQLSPEILTEIFQNLELADRKSVRLSCKLFYDACNQISIISQEKFVFRRGFCIKAITKTLLSCQYLRLNLEFQGLPLNMFPRKIWTLCGDKVYSLTFYLCLLTNEVVKNVIIHCRNMKHWNIGYSCNLWFQNVSLIESMKPFEELVNQKIIRKQLENLEVLIDERHVNAFTCQTIFAIFPNVKTFRAPCWYSCTNNNVSNYSQVSTYPLFAFNSIDECLVSMNIERLLFDLTSDGQWLKNSSVWNLRLKEIQTSLYQADRIIETLFGFFSHQKLLEVVCLTVTDISDKLFKKLLLHIIKECSNLRSLRLHYPTTYTIELNVYEFSLLLQKRLDYLNLRFNVDNFQTDEITMTVRLPVNRNLHTLVVFSSNSYENYSSEIDYVVIMEYFQNLKHLDICCRTDEVLQAIIKYQVNLEILKLTIRDNCTNFGFTGHRGNEEHSQPVYSIRRLKNLQCLHIRAELSQKCIEDALLECVFPKLKHFYFACKTPILDSTILAKNFVKIAKHAPLLEIVNIYTRLNFSQLFHFCCKLKKLYYISCAEADILDIDPLKLLRSSPSLRLVADYNQTFCLNPFTRKISRHPWNSFDIHSECAIEDQRIS